MTKQQLANLGIVIEQDEIADDEAYKLIRERTDKLSAESTKLKGQVDKYSTEIADYKRKEKDRMSEDEKKALEQEEVQKELASLRRENTLNKKVSELTAVGYPHDLATKIIEAELDGKSTAKYHADFVNSKLEEQKAELLKSTPRLNGGDGGTVTKDEFNKMSVEKQIEIKVNDPTLYAELTKKE